MKKVKEDEQMKEVFETLASRYKLGDDEVQEAYNEIVDYLYDAITDMEWLLTMKPIEVTPCGKFVNGSKINFVNPEGEEITLVKFKE